MALSSSMVRDVREDMNGNIWIATDHIVFNSSIFIP
ncbi:two-component regulator propeller domain-containing protein [Parabacteroides distasonis]